MNILISGGASGLGADITKVLAQDKSNTVYFTYNSAQYIGKVSIKYLASSSVLKIRPE